MAIVVGSSDQAGNVAYLAVRALLLVVFLFNSLACAQLALGGVAWELMALQNPADRPYAAALGALFFVYHAGWLFGTKRIKHCLPRRLIDLLSLIVLLIAQDQGLRQLPQLIF